MENKKIQNRYDFFIENHVDPKSCAIELSIGDKVFFSHPLKDGCRSGVREGVVTGYRVWANGEIENGKYVLLSDPIVLSKDGEYFNSYECSFFADREDTETICPIKRISY